jgi:hypothetical protein
MYASLTRIIARVNVQTSAPQRDANLAHRTPVRSLDTEKNVMAIRRKEILLRAMDL